MGGGFWLWCLIVFDAWFGRWVGALMMHLVSLVLSVWPAMDAASTLSCLQGLGRNSCFVSWMHAVLKPVAAFCIPIVCITSYFGSLRLTVPVVPFLSRVAAPAVIALPILESVVVGFESTDSV